MIPKKMFQKSLIFLLVLVFLFGISAMSFTAQTVEVPTTTTELQQGDDYVFYIDKIEEYHSFIQETELPENFIYYEQLQEFGKFIGYGDWDSRKPYSETLYSFIDENDVRFSITINVMEDESAISGRGVQFSSPKSDLRVAPEEIETGYLIIGDFLYQYGSLGLVSITWQIEDLRFKIFNRLFEYPQDGENTLMAQLLNLDTAEQATKKIRNAIVPEENQNNPYTETRNIQHIILPCAAGVLLGGGVVTFLLLRKRKRKQKIAEES